MDTFIETIIKNAVALVVSSLKFVPGMTATLFNQALDEARTQLDNAKNTFAEVQGEDTTAVVEGIVGNGLNIAQAALDAKGDTKADRWLQMAQQFIDSLKNNGGHPLAAAVSSWFKKTFGKKNT